MRQPSRIRGTALPTTACLGLALTVAGCAMVFPPDPNPVPLSLPSLVEQGVGTTVLLQAVSPVTEDVVWASGHGKTWIRTLDGGARWDVGTVPGPDTLQIRDVHGADALTAWALTSGSGSLSRVYRTDDGGAHWRLQWTNPEPAGFYDCLDFWDHNRGVLYGDEVDGGLRILVTDDGGESWQRVPADRLPDALPGEGGFAASGLCVQTGADGRAWIAAGNAARTRVFRTSDYGKSWRISEAPLETGPGAGLTAISMVDTQLGYAFGSDLQRPDTFIRSVAITRDGGATWEGLPAVSFPGGVYGGLAVPDTGGRVLVAVGPGGAAVSLDGGKSWTTIDDRSWWAVGSMGVDGTWVVGPGGRVAQLEW